MGETVFFKGGSMDGIGIFYDLDCEPAEGEMIIVQSDYDKNRTIGFWLGKTSEVYKFVQSLNSWVYDHESEVVEE